LSTQQDSSHIHTDAVDIELDLGAQELVPFVDGVDQIATAIKRTGAAEWMRKRGIGCEVGIDCFGLSREMQVSNIFLVSSWLI
jgi:hypothetical protein